MPTGYTCIIEDNEATTFRQYAIRCARAFGACVGQRDEALSNPPRAPEVSDHHPKEIARVKGRIAEFSNISPEAARALWNAECERVRKRNVESARHHATLSARYEAIRAEVEAWAAPTPDHEGVRRFMLEQIDISRPSPAPVLMEAPPDPAAYVADLLASARRELAYHEEEYAKEIARVTERAEWIRAFVNSLPPA